MQCIAKLVVDDLAAMTRFYSKAFAMVRMTIVESDHAVEAVMSAGAGQANVILYQYRDGRELTLGTAYGPLVFVTDDVDAAYDRALASGGSSLVPPANVGFRGPDCSGSLRAAFLSDPEGHPIEIASIDVAAFTTTEQIVTIQP